MVKNTIRDSPGCLTRENSRKMASEIYSTHWAVLLNSVDACIRPVPASNDPTVILIHKNHFAWSNLRSSGNQTCTSPPVG